MLLNLSSLGNDCGMSHTTARRWVSILETAFLVVLLRPHFRNFNERLIKSPKLYFTDTALLCYLLRIRNAKDLHLHAMRGSVFESLVISELIKNYVHRGPGQDPLFLAQREQKRNRCGDRGGWRRPANRDKIRPVRHLQPFNGMECWRKPAGAPSILPPWCMEGTGHFAVRTCAFIPGWPCDDSGFYCDKLRSPQTKRAG